MRPIAEGRVEQWAERYRHVMLRVALGLMARPDDAEDVVQRALVAAVARARRRPQAVMAVRHPRAWLAAITRNVALDTLRKRARRKRIRHRNEAEIREQLVLEPDFGWDADRLSERVSAAAERVLSAKQLRVVRGMLEGRTDAQISRDEGMARGSVRRLRSEAIRVLRGHFAESGGGGGGGRCGPRV